MKFLYIVDYWVPEYIGVVNLIASSDKEALEIIINKKLSEPYNSEYYSEIKSTYVYNDSYKRHIAENILRSQRFPLLPPNPAFKEFASGIIYFISSKRSLT